MRVFLLVFFPFLFSFGSENTFIENNELKLMTSRRIRNVRPLSEWHKEERLFKTGDSYQEKKSAFQDDIFLYQTSFKYSKFNNYNPSFTFHFNLTSLSSKIFLIFFVDFIINDTCYFSQIPINANL